MIDDSQFEDAIRLVLYKAMIALYREGFTEIHIGGMMRLLGIPNDRAAKHDNEMVVLDEDFVKYVEQIQEPRPPGQTLH